LKTRDNGIVLSEISIDIGKLVWNKF